MATINQGNGLSPRGQLLIEEARIRSHFTSIWANSYHAETNTDGVVNLGTAENYVMMPTIAEFVNKNVKFEGQNVDYGHGAWGSHRLRAAMAAHMDRYFNPVAKVDPEDLIFASGCTALFEMLGFTLFEEGETLLIGRPIYQAFENDFGLRAK
jgi:1-aminocyclopropane-1-carboxylate synthase